MHPSASQYEIHKHLQVKCVLCVYIYTLMENDKKKTGTSFFREIFIHYTLI